MSGLNGFHRPALDAVTPRLVDREDLTAVSALRTFRNAVASILGPTIGGVCIATFGFMSTYIIDVLTYLVALATVVSIRSMPRAEHVGRPGIRSIVAGLNYARSRPELIGTYLVDIVAMTFAMPMALFPSMAAAWGGPRAAGWLYSAMSIGSLVAS